MKTPLSLLPNQQTLEAGLTASLGTGPVKVVHRQLPRFMSTFPNEIVTCRFSSGRKRRVFIKYETGSGHVSYGHRGNIAHEAQVYEKLLASSSEFRPKYLGAYTDPLTGDTWLLLEYVYASVRVSDLSYHRSTRQPRALVETARWLGRFHAGHQNRVGEAGLGFLKRYDPEYYRGWARRTFDFAAPLQGRFPWLADLRLAGDAWFLPLLHGLTVIHGEFYAKTVLVRKEQLFMVDWESAAIAAGEIDLATLTEGKHWCGELTRQCEGEYRRARWPEGCPEDFDQRLDSARIYLHFRWLGDRPEWTTREKTLWRFDHLQAAAKRLGLL